MHKTHPDFSLRTRLLLGEAGTKRLANASVTVCGLGGVGSYAVEALARAGVGFLHLVDFDQVAPSNLNRQLCALHSTIGQDKTNVLAARIADISPECRILVTKTFINRDTAPEVAADTDYLLDAIDYLPGKIALVLEARKQKLPILCAMGAGRRLDPTLLRVADISQTRICPLARNFRRELRNQGIDNGVAVVFSLEQPLAPQAATPEERPMIGSLSFVPGAMGLTMASVAIRYLSGLEENRE